MTICHGLSGGLFQDIKNIFNIHLLYMKVYRGIFDIRPQDIDPAFIGQGSFGDGTHYAFDESTALAYCLDAKTFGIVYEAEIELSNNLELHSNKVKGLKGYRGDEYVESSLLGKVAKEFLTDRIKELGYDSVSLMGTIDGGEQLILINHNAQIKITTYKVIIHKNKNFINDNDLDWEDCSYDANYKISKSLTEPEIIRLCDSITLD